MDRIIIAKISEGLGNQLFMYANAYAISKKFDLNLVEVKNEILKHSKKYDYIKSFNMEKFDLKYSFPRKLVHKNIIVWIRIV